MGKKTKKTRWRALSIGEGPSDNDSQNGDSVSKGAHGARWHSTSVASNRYNSSHSTPTRHKYDQTSGAAASRWGVRGTRQFHSQQNGAAGSTRSSSTASETKITFNEDEYTKITTPRQDVLFKKGYLSKPKPHLQRPLTSAGNSTGDGTPDHQSADGADFMEGDYETPFYFPGNGGPTMGAGYVDTDTGVYYVNGFEGYGAPVMLYDQFGNAAMCFQPPLVAPQPLGPHAPSLSSSQRVKRYSTDSVPESTSPHNESNDQDPELVDDEIFSQEIERKKRRWRKMSQNTSTATSDNEDDPISEETNEENKCKYRVDAEEFVPRSYFPPPPAFVPIMPMPPPFIFVAGPPPPFYPPPVASNPQEHENIDIIEPSVTLEEKSETDDSVDSGSIPQPAIDIAKIVSKLEQAALEQKLMEETGNLQINDKTVEQENKVIKKEEKTIDEEAKIEINKKVEQKEKEKKELKVVTNHSNNNKTEREAPGAARYSDRLKLKTTITKQPNSNKPRTVPCPRLERTSSRCSAPIITANNSNINNTQPKSTTEWIPVSGKKKRKSKPGDSSSVNTSSEMIPDISPCPVVEIATAVEKPEEIIVEEPITPVEKPKKERTSSSKKPAKKRILITDPLPKVDDAPVKQPEETKKPVEAVETPEPKPEIKEVSEVKTKKKKHKKPKTNLNSSSVSLDSTINNESNDSTNGDCAPETQDVSQELDRMIQRGLYANLEHRLNPTDRFLADVVLRQGVAPSGAINMPRFSSVPFVLPTLRYHPPKPEIKPEIKENLSKEKSEVRDEEVAKFPITKAVKEWMDRTRETTPEVEIFKRPQDIREEFFVSLDKLEDIESENDVDGVSTNVEVEEIESKKCDRFESSPDLLECWENPTVEKIPPREETEDVEDAEDALQSYESLYGCSGDYARIESEVRALRPARQARHPRGDGGLPYRAICCTVM